MVLANIVQLPRRLSRKSGDITLLHPSWHPCTFKLHDEYCTKNSTANHDSVSLISQASTPHLPNLSPHLAQLFTTREDILALKIGKIGCDEVPTDVLPMLAQSYQAEMVPQQVAH
jgi:hypothetical protein